MEFSKDNICCDELCCIHNNGNCRCTAEQIHLHKCGAGPDEPACGTFTKA